MSQTRKSYTAKFKLQVIAFAEKSNSNSTAARHFSINEKQVREWRKSRRDIALMPKEKRAARGFRPMLLLEKDIKSVVEDLLNEVVKICPGPQNATVQEIYNYFNDPARSSQNTWTTDVTPKVSKNNVKVKPNVSSTVFVEDVPTGPRTSKAIAKEKIYKVANFPFATDFAKQPEKKTQTKEKAPTKKPKEIQISGRRIIDFSYFLGKIKEVNNHSESGRCNLDNIIFTYERKCGLCSAYYAKCTECGYRKIIWSENPKQKYNVNAQFINGMFNLKHQSLNVINTLLLKVHLPVIDDDVYFSELSEKKKELVVRSVNDLNTATHQSETIPCKNVYTEHTANSVPEYISSVPCENVYTEHTANSVPEYISSVPCKNTEDLERILIEDQLEIKQEENESEYEDDSDESEVILPHQTINEENEDVDNTYETLDMAIIKQEIDSDNGTEDLITPKLEALENVNNINYDQGSEKISQQIKPSMHNTTMIDNKSIDKFDNQVETVVPSKKARTLIHGSKTAADQNHINLNRKKAVHKPNSVDNVANFSKATMNTKNVPCDANSRTIMTDQQKTFAVHTNSGNNLDTTNFVNSANGQIIPTTFTNQSLFVVPVQCLPQPNNVVIGPPIHNSAAQAYQGLNPAPLIPLAPTVHQPPTSEPHVNQPPLQQLTNYCASGLNPPFIHPDAFNTLYTLRLPTVTAQSGNLLNTELVPSISGVNVNETLRPPNIVQQPANLSNNVPPLTSSDTSKRIGKGNKNNKSSKTS